MIDDDEFHWAFCRFQFQSELLLKRLTNGGPIGFERRSNVCPLHSAFAAAHANIGA